MSKWSDAFTQGYVCAVANLMRNHEEEMYAKELLMACVGSYEECVKCGVDESDLKVIKPLFKEAQ